MLIEAPRFDLDECRTVAEAEFVAALHARSESGGWFGDGWPREDRVIVTVCPVDPELKGVLRTLRVDFDGLTVVCGEDETHQLVGDLDVARADVVSQRGAAPSELAQFAADWLEREMARPIDRHEWYGWSFVHRRWVLADTGRTISISDSRNDFRRSLGTPDAVVRVWP